MKKKNKDTQNFWDLNLRINSFIAQDKIDHPEFYQEPITVNKSKSLIEEETAKE